MLCIFGCAAGDDGDKKEQEGKTTKARGPPCSEYSIVLLVMMANMVIMVMIMIMSKMAIMSELVMTMVVIMIRRRRRKVKQPKQEEEVHLVIMANISCGAFRKRYRWQ